MVAVNAIGDSEPAQLPGTIWSDVIPPPPVGVTSTPLDHGLRVVWRKPNQVGVAFERRLPAQQRETLEPVSPAEAKHAVAAAMNE